MKSKGIVFTGKRRITFIQEFEFRQEIMFEKNT